MKTMHFDQFVHERSGGIVPSIFDAMTCESRSN